MQNSTQDLIILTSPPASGKTYWIASLREALLETTILVISPLRALADECRAKWGSDIIVMTPEEWMGKKTFADIVIFDEFHLFFYWGDSFRPLMWEMFFEVSQKTKLTFLLTATLSESMRNEVSYFSSQFDQIVWHNHGNQILKYRPDSYVQGPSKNWLLKQIKSEKLRKNVKLIFCQYREEVFQLEERLEKLGYSCISCVGGESKHMPDKLKKNPFPDYIISTTVLSHGVNLPDIKKIYVLYEIQNLDFWIQMVARGGRRGQAFQVLALEKPEDLTWNFWSNLWHVFILSLKEKVSPQSLDFLF